MSRPLGQQPLPMAMESKEKQMIGRYSAARCVRMILSACLLLLTAILGTSASAQAAVSDYGIETVSASLSTNEAGRHPDVVTQIEFKSDGFPAGFPFAETESLAVDLPPGLTANPQRFPSCSFATFANSIFMKTACSADSQVGVLEFRSEGGTSYTREPLFSLDPPEDGVARLGFIGLFFPYYLDVDLRSGSDYGVTVGSKGITTALRLNGIRAEVWGVPADPIHDTERLTPLEAFVCGVPATPCLVGGSRASSLPPEPFTTNPVNCGPTEFGFKATAYELPGQTFTATASAGDIVGCEKVPFNPDLAIAPTSRRAGAPTGLEATLLIPQDEAINTVNSSPVRGAKVVLPEGMTVNSSAADGLAGCSAEQAGFETPGPANCPDSSKLGTLEITSPPLKRPIEGGIYLRTPEPGHLFRFWLVSNELGVNLKLPAEVQLDEQTGRLTTVIEESPQLPAEKVVLRFNGGARAPLRNPTSCGTFDATYELSPWSGGDPAFGVEPIVIDQGCEPRGFDPELSAGTVNPTAGAFSPFVFDVAREDGEENIASLDVALPQGLTAKLAGVDTCPEAGAASAACPSGSLIGSVKAATGAGSQPLWIPQAGKEPTAAFLGGPYKGAPYSVIAKVPAQAGPFDLGLVTVRSGIYVNPETAQVTVKSDSLPQMIQGIPIDYRHVRVEVTRDDFTLNPTSCDAMEVRASIRSTSGAVASPSDRFQAADCANLGFSPRLNLKLKGGTKRSDHPQLRAVLTAWPGQANIRRATVALPHSEFLDQAHIRTVCTRVQFAAEACPKGSIYGKASATTPLLDQPLKGFAYLRSSNHELPDLVLDLEGSIDIVLVGRIDSVNGGIRTTFEGAPDAPLSKFSLSLFGGKKGLLVNSTNICLGPHRANARFVGHNGRVHSFNPVLRNSCG
jgi:hypothetical protein